MPTGGGITGKGKKRKMAEDPNKSIRQGRISKLAVTKGNAKTVKGAKKLIG